MDEMRDVRPAPTVAVRYLNRIAVVFSVGFEPKSSERVGCKAFFGSCCKRLFLESGEHVLTEYSGEDVFDLAGEQRDLHFRIGLMLQQVIEYEHFAEYRSGLGGGEAPVLIEINILFASAGLLDVAALMGDAPSV